MTTPPAPDLSRFDRDPEALAWARIKVQAYIDQLADFERQAKEREATAKALGLAAARLLALRRFLGDGKCTIGVFDERLPGHIEAISKGPTDKRNADVPDLDRRRDQLIEAMSAVSEDRTCMGWAPDLERDLHAEGGIWEAIGRTIGWPIGNYEAWTWVTWEQATAHFADRSR